MKRLLAIVALLVLTGAIAMFTLQRRGRSGPTLDLPVGRAAELAPAEAVFFLELPAVDRTLARWKQTGIYQIWQEPEWQKFIAKWDQFAGKNPVTITSLALLEDLKKADPAGFFFASTSLVEPGDLGILGMLGGFDSLGLFSSSKGDALLVKGVGGFPYRGKKSDVEAVVQKMRTRLFSAWPGAKSELAKYGDVEIETITRATPVLLPIPLTIPPRTEFPKVHFAYRDNWFFFATDRELLTGTLDRYLRKPGAAKSLAENDLYSASAQQALAEPDLTVWARWRPLSTWLRAQISISGPQRPETHPDRIAIEAVHFTWKIDGPLLRDRLYFHLAKSPPAPALANRSLALTTPDTFALGVVDFDAFCGLIRWLCGGLSPGPPTSPTFEYNFAEGIRDSLEKLRPALGPEVAVISSWPDQFAYPWPDFLLAFEVRDAAKAKEMVTGWHKDSPGHVL